MSKNLLTSICLTTALTMVAMPILAAEEEVARIDLPEVPDCAQIVASDLPVASLSAIASDPALCSNPEPLEAFIDLELEMESAAPLNGGCCGTYMGSSDCQTGGWWSGTCSQCSGTCYFRYEGLQWYYQNGTRSCCWSLKTRCDQPVWLPTCNTTCSAC